MAAGLAQSGAISEDQSGITGFKFFEKESNKQSYAQTGYSSKIVDVYSAQRLQEAVESANCTLWDHSIEFNDFFTHSLQPCPQLGTLP